MPSPHAIAPPGVRRRGGPGGPHPGGSREPGDRPARSCFARLPGGVHRCHGSQAPQLAPPMRERRPPGRGRSLAVTSLTRIARGIIRCAAMSCLLPTALARPPGRSRARRAPPRALMPPTPSSRATRRPPPMERVPAGVTVIDRQQIEERGYQSLAEALASVPGLNLGADRRPRPAGQRFPPRHQLPPHPGADRRRARSTTPPTPTAPSTSATTCSVDMERIEVLRGPASSLYGSGAMGGVINLVTRRAPPDRAVAGLRRGRRRQPPHPAR